MNLEEASHRIEKLEEEIDEIKSRLGLPQQLDLSKIQEPKIIPPHPRLRKPRRGAKMDYASMWHTESEHLSHGEGSFERTR